MMSEFDNLFDAKIPETVKKIVKQPKKKESISKSNPPSSTSAEIAKEKGMSGGSKGVKERNLPEPASLLLSDLEFKVAWEGLSRVIKQLSGKTRSFDWKRGAIPVKNKIEEYLKKKKIIE